MNTNSFITAAELAQMLDVSVGHAYKVIHRLNEELKKMGYLTVPGRIPHKYLEERCYGVREEVNA